MKSPRKGNKVLHQETLAETWFSRNNYTKNIKNKSASDESKTKHTFNKSKATLNNVENLSDTEIIESSQDINESILRKKINNKLHKISKTTKSSPRKNENVLSSKVIDNVSNVNMLDINSVEIKEELMEGLDTNDYEFTNMLNDLNNTLVDSESKPNNSQISTHESGNIDLIKHEEHCTAIELQDSLNVDETNCNKESPLKDRLRQVSINKQDYKTSTKQSPAKLKQQENTSNSSNRSKQIIKNSPRATQESKLSQSELLKLKKLKSLKIKLLHHVPPQHEIEPSAGSRPLTVQQTKKFECYGPLKKGYFTKSEDEIIKRNWEDFCDIYNWDKKYMKPFLSMRHNGKYYMPCFRERKNFVQFIANGLPWRSLFSVYSRFKILYDSTSSGKYSAKEDKIIMSYLCNEQSIDKPYTCAQVAKILKRDRRSVWNHFQKLKKQHNLTNKSDSSFESNKKFNKNVNKYKKRKISKLQNVHNQIKDSEDIKWTSSLVKVFIDTLLEITSCKELMKLKNQIIDESVWSKLEESLEIDRIVLQNFWYLQLHMQMFCPMPIYLNEIKIKLIKYIYEEKVTDLEELIWENVCTNFDGVTPTFLSKLCEHLLKFAQTQIDSHELQDVMTYLYEKHIPRLEENSLDAILPKLTYENGRIICVDKGPKKKLSSRTTTNPFSIEEN